METLKSGFKHLQLGVRQDMDGMKKEIQEIKSSIDDVDNWNECCLGKREFFGISR